MTPGYDWPDFLWTVTWKIFLESDVVKKCLNKKQIGIKNYRWKAVREKKKEFLVTLFFVSISFSSYATDAEIPRGKKKKGERKKFLKKKIWFFKKKKLGNGFHILFNDYN